MIGKSGVWRFVAATVVFVIMLSGCSNAAQPTGHIDGYTYAFNKTVMHSMPTGAIVTATLVNTTATQTYTTPTGAGGSFTFDLPPGRYRLTAGGASPDSAQATPVELTLTAGITCLVSLYFVYA